MTPTIQSQLEVMHSADGMVDLFKLDCSAFGGLTYYFSPQCYTTGTNITWGGTTYNLMPIGIDNIEHKASTSTLPQPTLTISNVGGVLLSQIVSLGDFTGAVLTHWKTKASYLDGGVNPDTTRFIGPEVWYIFQKTSHTNAMIQWTLSTALDKPGAQFPIRQVLKDAGINPGIPVYFPGVTPYRIN